MRRERMGRGKASWSERTGKLGDMIMGRPARQIFDNQVVEANRQQSSRLGLAPWHDPLRQNRDTSLRRCPHHRRSIYL